MAFLNFQGDNVAVFSLRRDKLAMDRPNRNTVAFIRGVDVLAPSFKTGCSSFRLFYAFGARVLSALPFPLRPFPVRLGPVPFRVKNRFG